MIASESPVTVLDDYSPSTDFGPFPNCTQITLKLTGPNAATVQIFKGFQGSVDNLPEFTLTSPGYFSYAVHALGFRIKNAVAGSAAAYEAQAWFPDDPVVTYQVGGVGPFSAPNGLQYHIGTYGPLNVGDWLDVETTDATGSSASGYAVDFHGVGGFLVDDTSTQGVTIQESGAGGIAALLQAGADGGITLGVQGASDTVGISLQNSGQGPITIQNVSGAGQGKGDITIRTVDSASGEGAPTITLYGSHLLGNGIAMGTNKAQVNINFGNTGVNILGTGGGSATSPGVGVTIDGSFGGPHPSNDIVDIGPTLRLIGIAPEPNATTIGAEAAVLYLYDDGSGHPKLKVFFSKENTRVLLATG